jgi:ABC-type polysaccharide/polyol phosphate export permease
MIGQAAWQFFDRMLTGSVNLIINNRDLVTKVYVPKYILLYSKSLTYLFKMFISLALAFGLMLFQQVPLSWHIVFIIPVLFVLYLVSFGIGLLLMHFGVTLNDLSNLTNIALKMTFYLSGVFFNIRTRLQGRLGYFILRLNPAAFLMDEMRKALIYAEMPNFKWLAIWLVAGTLLVSFGIRVIHKNENSYAKVI